MKLAIKYASINFVLVLLTACGGGGVDAASSEDAADALAQKIRNAVAAVSAMSLANSSNN
jgi:hypothetical protein